MTLIQGLSKNFTRFSALPKDLYVRHLQCLGFFKYIGGPSLRNLKDWMEGRYLEGPGTIAL